MPPSGYNSKQSSCVRSFLRSCFQDLVTENEGVRNPTAALNREILHIDTDIRIQSRSAVATKVLELTKAFYEQLLTFEVDDFKRLGEFTEVCLDRIEESILEIHVADVVF